MSKNTMGTKLPRKLEQKMQIVGEQISRVLYAFQLDNDILFLVKEDAMGKASQDLNLKKRESI